MPSTDARGRAHIVLVPGFAGFDALGQIEYYAGVTPLLQRWKASTGAHHAVLHYFDNLPTANVATRAKRLGAYLAKRLARGEFQPGDTLALVGHSTGGLDIRRMVLDLAERARTEVEESIPVDGAANTASRVQPEAILGMHLRLVFLSVPQWGTNIADWVRARPIERQVTVESLRNSVAAARLPKVDIAQSFLVGLAANATEADFFRAVQDALAEMDEHAVRADAPDRPSRLADAQDAQSQVALWLRHIATDFGAIDDLASGVPPNCSSPAQFDAERRRKEQATWDRYGIASRSYATVASRPYDLGGEVPVPVFDLCKPWRSPPETGLEGTDLAYRLCYRACAGGPFTYPEGPIPPLLLFAGHGQPWPLEPWDNDGIVNTASMLWPEGAKTRLVHADHGDIIGHFALRPAKEDTGRRYDSYDLLGSASHFDQGEFEKVWRDVFDVCVER